VWCRAWRKKKLAARQAAEEDARRERHRKGLLTGREIFMEAKTAITDDDTAAGDDDMLREVDEELEIAKMNALAAEEHRRARAEVCCPRPPDDACHACITRAPELRRAACRLGSKMGTRTRRAPWLRITAAARLW
jgi:DRG Family Regulatory Proteins, Tma46